MQWATCNGFAIHYKRVEGSKGKTFFCINSLGTDLRIWDEFVTYVQPHGSVLLFDKRGHGLSEMGESPRTIQEYAKDASALLDQLEIEKCMVIGLSIGGLIGMEMAINYSDRVEKLVLSNTAPKIANAEFWENRIAQVQRSGLPAASSGIVDRWFSNSYKAQNPVAMRGYRVMLGRTPLEGYVSACEAIMSADYSESIRNIGVPTLCLGGAEDLAISRDLVNSMAERIPAAQSHFLDDSAHISCVDQAKDYSKRILDFFL